MRREHPHAYTRSGENGECSQVKFGSWRVRLGPSPNNINGSRQLSKFRGVGRFLRGFVRRGALYISSFSCYFGDRSLNRLHRRHLKFSLMCVSKDLWLFPKCHKIVVSYSLRTKKAASRVRPRHGLYLGGGIVGKQIKHAKLNPFHQVYPRSRHYFCKTKTSPPSGPRTADGTLWSGRPHTDYCCRNRTVRTPRPGVSRRLEIRTILERNLQELSTLCARAEKKRCALADLIV